MQRQLQQLAKSTSGQRGSFYDQNFRLEASCNPSQSWAKLTQAFTHSASLAWQRAQRAGVTPVRAWTIPLTTAQQVPVPVQPTSDPSRLSQGNRETPLLTCLKYSRNDGKCPFGSRCRCCSRCKGSHPVKRCPLAATGPREKHEALTRAHQGLVIVANGCGGHSVLIYIQDITNVWLPCYHEFH